MAQKKHKARSAKAAPQPAEPAADAKPEQQAPTEDRPFDRLPPQRQIFVLEYIKDFNGTQAVIRAGYSEKTARSIASELLTFPDVKAAIRAEIEAKHEKLSIEADDILREIATIAFGDLSQVMVWGEHEQELIAGETIYDKDGKPEKNEDGSTKREPDRVVFYPSAARLKAPYEMGSKVKLLAEVTETQDLRKITHKFKMHDKMKALELLAKHKKLITDKIEHEVGKSLEELIVEARKAEKEGK